MTYAYSYKECLEHAARRPLSPGGDPRMESLS